MKIEKPHQRKKLLLCVWALLNTSYGFAQKSELRQIKALAISGFVEMEIDSTRVNCKQ